LNKQEYAKARQTLKRHHFRFRFGLSYFLTFVLFISLPNCYFLFLTLSLNIQDMGCFVDARQRNERDARMGAAETGWEQVDSSAEFHCFY
jgi:hypothetical protein